jgi:SAM-dependent methyltransferase
MKPDGRWYEGFFEGIVLEMWRKAIPADQTHAEAEFLRRELKLNGGARVLDVPCGGGRHAIELASRGFRMTGVDISEEQIEAASRAAESAGVRIAWNRAEMRELPWDSEFDAGYCFGNSFGYLDPDGTRGFLRAIARALKPGARFALDTGVAAECILPRFRERESARFEDIEFREENRYHAAESCIETIYTFARGADRSSRTGFQWVFTIREIRGHLEGAGLQTLGLYRSLEGEPFQLGSPCLYLVAERTAAGAAPKRGGIRSG